MRTLCWMLYSENAVDTERTHGRLVLSGSAQHRIAAIRRPTPGQLLCAVDHQRPVCHLRRPTESTGQTDDSRSRCRLLRMCLTADRMQFLLTSSRPGAVTPLNPLKRSTLPHRRPITYHFKFLTFGHSGAQP